MMRLLIPLFLLSLLHCSPVERASVEMPVYVTFGDTAKNIIIMIGDGMGVSQLTSAMYMNENYLNLEHCRSVGLMNVESENNLITDSAAGATAFATGKKTNNNMLSVSPDGESYQTIFQEGEKKGYSTGIVVTSSIVHATPAAFVTNHPFRWFYEEIAASYLKEDTDLMIGGGERYFKNREKDNRNLLKEFKARNYSIHSIDQKPLRRIDTGEIDKLLYFTAENQPPRALAGRNYLPEACRFGFDFLAEKSDKGFLMLIEGSQIDMAAHHWKADEIVSEVLDFDEAVGEALRFLLKDRETLLLVTSDHETAGMAIIDGSKMGKLKLTFATNAHTPQLVPVFAIGPGEELFSGIYDNTQFHYKMRKALGWK